MTEVELKATLTDQQAAVMPERLLALGFAPSAALEETDLYFNGSGERDFRKTAEALRLRRRRDLAAGTEGVLMTYKGPKIDPRSNTRTEHETSVGDLETGRKLLEALGLQAQFTVDKTRREYTGRGVTVCLDAVEGLGSFLELETLLEDGSGRDAAVDRLLALLDQLGVSREALSRKSYLELLIASATVKKSSQGM